MVHSLHHVRILLYLAAIFYYMQELELGAPLGHSVILHQHLRDCQATHLRLLLLPTTSPAPPAVAGVLDLCLVKHSYHFASTKNTQHLPAVLVLCCACADW